MFAYAYTILAIIIVAFLVAKIKLSTELSMLFATCVAALYHGVTYSGDVFPVRHIVEGMFTYFDVCLTFITATFFMILVKESGGVAFIVRRIVARFREHRTVCLLLLTLVMLIPGALTGSGATSVLTVGALVGTVLAVMGVNETKRTAAIFLTAAMSAAAPPINLWAMMAAAGANMPYVGFTYPLGILSVFGALFSMFYLAWGGASLDGDKVLETLPEAPEKMGWLRVLLPFAVLAGLIIGGRVAPFSFPVVGLPLIFIISALAMIALSPVKLGVWKIATDTVRNLLPLVGIMVVVGALNQVMAMTGARGLLSLLIVTLPMTTLFATLFFILPISEGILQYAVAPLVGVPLIMLFNMKGLNPIIALSAMAVLWPLGDCLPPTAVVGRAAVMELDYKGRYYKDFVAACFVPFIVIAVLCTLFLVFSKDLSFLAQ
ncbi:C4-dicarboxylate ABC transporter [Cloacibacillus evryensis]|uniref:C4-dicarboxylate ABC transporter n=1 Tax=Cloacibacillus evryensis TaxID=508460 RepID=UPI003A8B1362